ncbi:MAG TPA: hypothetical protein VNM90_11940, partial [Haliangium sp.]|nr:hypothetical protein [Haliangium sp.]
NGKSQLMQAAAGGGIPGAAFSASVDCHLDCETVQVKMTFDLVVTYVGGASLRSNGALFTCGVFGKSAGTWAADREAQ